MPLCPITLTTPQDLDNFQNKLTRLRDNRDLKSRLFVAANGQTYLLNDIEALSEEELANENLYFPTAQGTRRSLKDLKSSVDLRNYIHNKPLATYLSKIHTSAFINLKIKHCPITRSPIVFPAITNLEDEFEYDALIESITTRKRHPISNEEPYTHDQAIPNIALGQLFKLNYYQLKAKNKITPEQTKTIIEMCHLRLNKVTNARNDLVSNDALYNYVVAKDPTLKTKTLVELIRKTNELTQEKTILESANSKLQGWLTTLTALGTIGLGIAAIVTPTVFLSPAGVITGSLGVLATAGSFIAKGIVSLYYKNKITDVQIEQRKVHIVKTHLEDQQRREANLQLAREKAEVRKYLNDFKVRPTIENEFNRTLQSLPVTESKDALFYPSHTSSRGLTAGSRNTLEKPRDDVFIPCI